MTEDFERGLSYVFTNVGGATGGAVAQQWVGNINDNISQMTDDMIKLAAEKNSDIPYLQGFMAEAWHEHTFNINSTIHHTSIRAGRPDVNSLGSADIQIGTKLGEDHQITEPLRSFSLKSYNMPENSVRAQSETFWERYSKLKSKAENKGHTYKTFDEFLADSGRPDLIGRPEAKMSLYHGQGKIISSDMCDRAKALLHKKIMSLEGDISLSPEGKLQLQRYKEVFGSLDKVVSDGKGNESLQLSHADAIKLASAAKAGRIDDELLEECGLDISDLVSAKDIACESLKAGLSAAAISLILSITPTIVNGVSMLITEGEVDVEALKKGGVTALSISARSFLSGSITAALTASCETGKFGDALVGADTMAIASLVAVSIGTVDSALKFANGKIDKSEMAREIMQMYVTTAFSYIGGTAFSAIFDGFPFAYMLGSFIGGILGGLIYSGSENLLLSFCIDSGCTFFGLVDQNYTLPTAIIDELGLEQFDFEKMETDVFAYDTFTTDKFSIDSFEYEKFGIKILRRDLIGVFSVGYT